jgi:hypothetical protein
MTNKVCAHGCSRSLGARTPNQAWTRRHGPDPQGAPPLFVTCTCVTFVVLVHVLLHHALGARACLMYMEKRELETSFVILAQNHTNLLINSKSSR